MAKKDSPIKLKQDADAAEKSGRFDRAIELLKQIVADNPRDWNTVNRIGDLYAKINKLKEANEQYVKYASYLAEDGFYLKSIAVWKKVLRNDPSLIEAQLKLGDLYARQGLAAEARQTFDGVFNEYVKRNKMREAGEVLRRAAEVDPGDLKVRIKLAELYAREGDQGRAAKEYGAIGDELVKKGHHAEALQLIDKALRSGPRSPHLLAAAAQIHIVQKDYPRAIELLEEARRANPADRDVSLRMAEAYLGARRAQEARRVLEALLQRDSNDQDARQQLGQVYVFEGRYDEAFDHLLPVVDKLVEKRQVDRGAALLQGLVQRNPQHFKSLAKLVELYRLSRNDMLVAQTYGQMVEAYMAQAAHEQAASILDMLVQLEPHNEQHRTKLKWLRDQKGVAGGGPAPTDLKPASASMVAVPPVPAARPGLELSPPLSPDDHEFISEHLAEGRVFRKYGLGDKARDQFEAVIGRFPDNLEALSELADIAKEKGDNAGAAQRLRVMAEVHRLKGEADKAARADADADALAGPVAAPAAAPAPIAPPPPPAAAPPIALIPPVALAPPPAEMDVDISLEEPVPAPSPPEEELEYVEMPADAHAGQAPEFDAADLAPAGEIGSQYIEEEAQTLVPDSAFDLEEAPAPLPLVPVGLRAPAHVAPPPASDVPADLRRALEEIETYVSMGFVDDARSVLAEVGGRFSAHPALQQRLAELGLELEAPSDMDALLGEAPAVDGRARGAERRAAAARRGLSRVHAVDEAADGARARGARGRGRRRGVRHRLRAGRPLRRAGGSRRGARSRLEHRSRRRLALRHLPRVQEGRRQAARQGGLRDPLQPGHRLQGDGAGRRGDRGVPARRQGRGAAARVREHAGHLLHREGHAQARDQVVREGPAGPWPQGRGVSGPALRPRERPRAGRRERPRARALHRALRAGRLVP